MSPEERIGQLFIYNVPAQNNTRSLNSLSKAINEQHIGGILFWEGTIREQAVMTNYAQAISKIPLMITLDGEWGLSMRLKDGIRFPKKMTLGALKDENLIYELGKEMGRECNELRINVDFDPVLDVNLNPQNPVINLRSFGDNPLDVSRKANLFTEGLKSQGVVAVAKHFPGHGDTSQDSHEELAVVTHDRQKINDIDLLPYKDFIKNPHSGVMVGHISVPAIDSTGTPASLSPVIINGLLKKELGYKGLIFTDGLKMKAVSNIPGLSAKALLAGNDVLLDPMYLEKEYNIVLKAVQDSTISMSIINEKCKRVLTFKYYCGLKKYKPIIIDSVENKINTPQALALQQKLAQQCISVIKNENNIIPVKGLNKYISVISIGTTGSTQFNETAGLYGQTNNFGFNGNEPLDSIRSFNSKTDSAKLLIFSIHNNQMPDSVLSLLMGNKPCILAFVTSPYNANQYPLSIAKAKGCLIAYENLRMTQDASAQVIFGGIGTNGKLAVNLPKATINRGCGLPTTKTRLGYCLPENNGMSSLVLQKIDSIALNAIKNGAMPGCQILVARKGMIVYRKSFGYQDYKNQVPVKNSDVYDLASVTKISATLPVIMKLYDTGRLETLKKISSYLPDTRNSNKRDITIYDLLTHQAGLKASLPLYQQAINMKSVDDKLIQNNRNSTYNIQIDQTAFANKNMRYKDGYITKVPDSLHSLQIADSMYLLSSFRDSIWQQIKLSPVSSQKYYVYSDLSFMVLERVVEKITKQNIDDLSRNWFYTKLGANRTGYYPLRHLPLGEIIPTEYDSLLRKQQIRGYVHDQNAAFMGGMSGHAGNFSNANDLAKLYQMILNGGTYGDEEYLKKETCNYFTTNKSPISRRGLGFDREEPEENLKRTMFGHTGFTGTCVWVDPKEGIIYIFLSNRVCPQSWNKKLVQMNVRTEIEKVIYKAIIQE
jgi:beta-glucosidase-like glycosyl hydrolase/CubicO group peptidase (beta-lactamase class C family)